MESTSVRTNVDDYRPRQGVSIGPPTVVPIIETAAAETEAQRYERLGIKIVSLSGYAQSGKDTVAKILVDHGEYKRVAFADALKAAVLALDPYIPMPAGSSYRLSTLVDIMGMEKAKLEFPEVRRLLQVMGTEVGRQLLGENVWVNKVVEQFRPTQKYVVTDTRFGNEYSRLRDLGATMVWVSRPGVGPLNDHASENSISENLFDIRLENNGTFEELHDIVEAAFH